MKHIILALIFTIAASANADSLYTGAWSYHLDPAEGINNETHNLLAYERKGYILGGFINSYGDPTALLAKKFGLFELGHFEGSLYAGITYGYMGCQAGEDTGRREFCPALVPEISYTKHKLQPSLLLLAEENGLENLTVAVAIKWDL